MRQIQYRLFSALLLAWCICCMIGPAPLRATENLALDRPDVAHLALPTFIESQPLLPRSETNSASHRAKRLWWISVAAVAGATALDAFSSWNRTELNPVLRSPNGSFRGKGAAIKFGLAGAVVLMEGLAVKNDPQLYRSLSITNFAIAGGYASIAGRNMSLSR